MLDQRRNGTGRAGRASPGVPVLSFLHRTPYRFPVHTGYALRVHLRCTRLEHPVMTYTMLSVREQAPGLRGLFRTAAMLPSRATPPCVLLHPRSIWPGHPDRPRTIRGKCWIASRSLLARLGQAPRAWLGGLGPSRRPFWASWTLDPGLLGPSRTPGSGHPGPRIRASWPARLARKADIPASSDRTVG